MIRDGEWPKERKDGAHIGGLFASARTAIASFSPKGYCEAFKLPTVGSALSELRKCSLDFGQFSRIHDTTSDTTFTIVDGQNQAKSVVLC